MTVKTRNPGYRISGLHPLAEDGPGGWEDLVSLPHDQLVIGWREVTHLEATVVEYEGLEFRLFHQVRLSEVRPDALDDLVYIWEESLTSDAAAPLRAADGFFRLHGPLYLCDAHGLPVTHLEEGCPKTSGDLVSAIVELAGRLATALKAAGALRAGDPVDHLIAELGCPDPELPTLLRILEPEQRRRLRMHVDAYPVREWLQLEAWVDRFAADCKHQSGVLPHVVRQLRKACHREHRHWLCEHADCANFFVKTRSDRKYCGKEECNRARARERVGVLPYCPVCKQHMGGERDFCSSCERLACAPSDGNST